MVEKKKRRKLTEEEREYRKKYYAEHKEYFREVTKKYRLEHKDYYDNYNKKYYEENPEYFYEKNKQYRNERLGLYLYGIQIIKDESIYYAGSTIDLSRMYYHKNRYKLKELIDNKISYRVLYVNLLDLDLDIPLDREDLFMLEQSLINKLENDTNKKTVVKEEEMFEYKYFFDTLLFSINDKFKVYEEKIFEEGVV